VELPKCNLVDGWGGVELIMEFKTAGRGK